jgi:uncharacterized protein (DUF1800 family)
MTDAPLRGPAASRVPWAWAAVLAVLVGTVPAFAGGVRAGSGGFGSTTTRPPADESDALRHHVLSRTTYGASAASLAEMRAVGVDEYLRRQLNPVEIDDAAVEGMLAAQVAPPGQVNEQWLLTDCVLPDNCYRWNDFYYEHLLRARYSERQLQEIMVQFWENHFDTVTQRGNNENAQHFWTGHEYSENVQFRENALGNFRDLLEISAKSQAMQYFLDNFRSTVFTLNENYARELLELHSLGVDCAYEQDDVVEVARIFTGWSGVDLPGAPVGPRDTVEGTYLFRAAAHDATEKTALGHYFPPGGMLDEGERLLDIVAEHPCTARFISFKLIEAFVTDKPTDAYIDRIAETFLNSNGHVQTVLEAIFASPEFRDPQNFDAKVRTPVEFTVAALRATDAWMGARRSDGLVGQREIYNYVRLQGMDLFDYPIPTGYYEDGGEWVSGNGFLQRWRFAETLSRWTNDDRRYTYIDPMVTVSEYELTDAEAIVQHFATLIAGPDLPDETKQALVDILTNGTGVWEGSDSDLRQMISHLLGSPEFMQQ